MLARCLVELARGDLGDEVDRAAGAAVVAEAILMWRHSMTRRPRR